jgi:hypothetical protein
MNPSGGGCGPSVPTIARIAKRSPTSAMTWRRRRSSRRRSSRRRCRSGSSTGVGDCRGTPGTTRCLAPLVIAQLPSYRHHAMMNRPTGQSRTCAITRREDRGLGSACENGATAARASSLRPVHVVRHSSPCPERDVCPRVVEAYCLASTFRAPSTVGGGVLLI